MNQSYYGSTSRLIPKRAKGYTRQGKSYVNSSHLSMTQPYAAGSLLSTVEDMAKWDQALYTDKLLSRESLELMWTKTKLNDGSETDYGFGWSLSDYQGKAMVHHGGGINGFSTYAIRLEAEKLFIVVLGNTDNPLVRPGAIARNITRTVLGK